MNVILKNMAYAKSRLEYLRHNRDTAIERNKIYDTVKRECSEIEEKVKEVEDIIKSLGRVQDNINIEYSNFRNRRVSYLSDTISDTLVSIFPDLGFKAKIIYSDKRRTVKPTLYLEDTRGNIRKPHVTEGKLCQYLITYAAVLAVNNVNGCNKCFIDEAFGVASSSNRPILGRMLQEVCGNGTQMVLISQNSDLYSDINRNEICLVLNNKKEVEVLTS